MSTAQANGVSLELVERGSGEPLVLVHGSASDHRTWQGQLDAFAQRFRVVAYSRRYHWPNARIHAGTSYAMAEHVDDLEALLRTLSATPAHLVGHSYGGVVCLLLAVRAPELVRGLVLAEPPVVTLLVSIPPSPMELATLALHSPATAVAIARLGALGLGPATSAAERGDMRAAMRLMGTAILGLKAFRNLSEARVAQIRDNLSREELVSPEALPPLDPDQIRGIRNPVLLVGGERSPRVFARLSDHLQELLPDAERTEIPHASHLMHEDNAAAYNRAVTSFLSRQ